MQKSKRPGGFIKSQSTQPTLKSASGMWTIDEAFQAHRNNQWPQPNLFQPISKSLRFKYTSSGGSVLTRNPARTGDQTRMTWSSWVKRGNVYSGNYSTIFCWRSAAAGSSYLLFDFNQADNLFVLGSDGTNFTTTQAYRDPSAWYHIVLAMDTNQSVAANRLRLYVNGVQVTAYGSPIWPTQGATLQINTPSNALIMTIGNNPQSTQLFDGEMAEVNYIDGLALDPTFFGTYGSDGVWTAKTYTGSYGTNGFYLPFNNFSNSQTPGYDTSIFTTYDADQDPYRGSVALHLTGNGPTGQQNNFFTDSSPNGLTITRNGTPAQGSFAPYAMGTNVSYNPSIHGASAYFNGSTDYLSTQTFSLPTTTTPFTMECWIYPTAFNTGTTIASSAYGGSGNIPFVLGLGAGAANEGAAGSAPWFGYYTGAAWIDVNSSITLSANNWYHIAGSYDGTTARIYVNGVLGGSIVTPWLGVAAATSGFYIGRRWDASAPAYYSGYISNFRFIIGTALYTNNFIPANQPCSALPSPNLIPLSEQFQAWPSISALTFTVNTTATLAPDGSTTATYIVPSSAAGYHYTYYNLYTPTVGQRFVGSVYAKAGAYSKVAVEIFIGGFDGACWFDLSAGTIYSSSTGFVGSIVSVGNGWYRCIVVSPVTTSTTSGGLVIHPQSMSSDGANVQFTGDGVSGIYAWGAQFEIGSSVSAYSPTPINYGKSPNLLLNFAGAAVVDSAGANNVITYNNATITSNSKYGYGALSFASSDYLSIPYSSSMYFGTANFTIECWWRSNTTQSNYAPIISQGFIGSPSIGSWALKVASTSNNIVEFTYVNTSSGLVNLDSSYSTHNDGNWHHIAVTRLNATLLMFIDGLQVAISSIQSSQYVGVTNTAINIGYQQRDNVYTNGMVDDLRITNGVARYTSNFTVPVRAMPEVGGKSLVTSGVNTGVVKSFTTVGTTTWTAPMDVSQIELLVVGGGGGGGGTGGTGSGPRGGGGGGGLVYYQSFPVTPGLTYTVTVGAGGTGGNAGLSSVDQSGTNGGNSVFGPITAYGGGGGAGYVSGNQTTGLNGGSAGGSAYTLSRNPGTAGQGFSSGASFSAGATGAGGGGGAGGNGGDALSADAGGNGGPGLYFAISGSYSGYAGGGGAGNYPSGTANYGSATAGGGGGGGGGTRTPIAGTANTGGGGGGAGAGNIAGGAGGSGVVIIRYTTATTTYLTDSTTDVAPESPTSYGHDYQNGGEVVGNYATWNPLQKYSAVVLSNGNLTSTNSTEGKVLATIGVTSGKWYWEVTGNTGNTLIGLSTQASVIYTPLSVGYDTTSWAYYSNGGKYNSAAANSYGAAYVAGDVIGVAFDADAGTLTFYKNGVSQGVAFSGLVNAGPYFPAVGNGAASGYTANFGQRPWAYAPPAGFLALNTRNLLPPTISNPNQHFDVVPYNGGTRDIFTPAGFAPGLVWIKSRSDATNWAVFDVARGITAGAMALNTTAAEGVENNMIFRSNGFSYANGGNYDNLTGSTYVAFCWRASDSNVINTSGATASTVSANTTAGFSIVTYTGTGTNTTVGHGLNAVPKFMVFKSRDVARNWLVETTATGSFQYLYLNLTVGTTSQTHALPTSSVFTLVTGAPEFNNLNERYVAYCWAEVPGYSKIDSYAGTGLTDGPFVYCGFQPRFVMIKRTDTANDWDFYDTVRDTYNPASHQLIGRTNIESTAYTTLDIVSNGFKLRNALADGNASGGTYLFMAFAENPFKTVRAK